jgi:hypothetical protein
MQVTLPAAAPRPGGGKKRSAARQVFVGGYIPADLATRAKHLAAARNMSMNELIVALLAEATKKGNNDG